MSTATQFEQTGSLSSPGPIGRLVRLGLGLWITYAFFQFLDIGFLDAQKADRFFSWQTPTHSSFWIAVLIFFWVFPYVFNIGFSRNWRRKPQWLLVGALVVAATVGYALEGSLWSPAMGWLILIWLLYVTAHLGFSFLLAAVLGTPGCEMRAFHHLWTILTEKKLENIIVPVFSIESTNGKQIGQRKLKKRYQYESRKKCSILGCPHSLTGGPATSTDF